MSVAEYLRRERDDAVQHEDVGGFISPLHAEARGSGPASCIAIAGCIQVALYAAAKAQDGCLYHEGMQLCIPSSSFFILT